MTAELQTSRLILRSFVPGDFDAVYTLLYADAAVARWWTGRCTARNEVQDWFSRGAVWQLDGGFGFRAIVHKTDSAVLGLMGFQRFEGDEDLSYVKLPPEIRPVAADPVKVDAELTYALGRPYQRRGYATEAARVMLLHGFQDLGISRVVNIVDERNIGTIALMNKLGFEITPNLLARPDWPSVVGILENPGS